MCAKNRKKLRLWAVKGINRIQSGIFSGFCGFFLIWYLSWCFRICILNLGYNNVYWNY